MFGNDKANRRRRPAGHTLEARLRGDVAPARLPWHLRALARLAFLAAVACAAAGAAFWLRHHWVHSVPALAIREVKVATGGVLAPEEIRRLAGVAPGRNILSVDLPALRDRLERHPRIAAARIDVEFPGTLSIRVRERVPVAVVRPLASNGISAAYLLDEEGHVMLPLDPATAPAAAVRRESALPVLSGYRPGAAAGDERAMRAALALIARFRGPAAAAVPPLREVSIAVPGVLVTTNAEGEEITFGALEPDRQLARWVRTRARLEALRAAGVETNRLAALDLSVSQNAPIRWARPAPLPPENQDMRRDSRRRNRPKDV